VSIPRLGENAVSHTSGGPEKTPAVGRPDRSRWQVGLGSLAFLVLVIAVWMTYFVNRLEIDRLESRIAALRPMSRELVVTDPSQIAAVGLTAMWFDENRWEVYLPEGSYRLRLATREVATDGLAPAVKSLPIGPGWHRVDLEIVPDKAVWKIAVGLDRAGRVEAEEPKEWASDRGSEGGGQVSRSQQQPADRPLVLFRRRFMPLGRSAAPIGPTDGVLLWIERTAGPP